MKLTVTIINQSGRALPQAFLKTWVASVSRELKKRIGEKPRRELVIAFVSRTQIQKLNREFRGKNKPTDVLSFAPSFDDAKSLGELAISPEVISAQAREHGLLVREELGYMILHGILHLLGYDHESSAKDASAMFALQDEIFESLTGASAAKSGGRRTERSKS